MPASSITDTGPLPTEGWRHENTWTKAPSQETCKLCLGEFVKDTAYRPHSSGNVHITCLINKWRGSDPGRQSSTPSTTDLNSAWVAEGRKTLERMIKNKRARLPKEHTLELDSSVAEETALVDSSSCFRCGLLFRKGDKYRIWTVTGKGGAKSKVNVHTMTKTRAGCQLGSTRTSQEPIYQLPTTVNPNTTLPIRSLGIKEQLDEDAAVRKVEEEWEAQTTAGPASTAEPQQAEDVPENWEDEVVSDPTPHRRHEEEEPQEDEQEAAWSPARKD